MNRRLVGTVLCATRPEFEARCYYDRDCEEFVVVPRVDGKALPEVTHYYTDDEDDAKATAALIVVHLVEASEVAAETLADAVIKKAQSCQQ